MVIKMRAPHIKCIAVAFCALWLGVTSHAQAPGIAITPADPVLSVGQFQQFTVTGAVTPTNVSAGGEYTCVGLSDGTARCTGRNQFGQLANGTFTNSAVLVATSLTNVNVIVAADEFGCALLRDATVTCWGLGESGQRGDGTFTTFSSGPALVAGVGGAVALAGGYGHACVLLQDHSMQCWGRNLSGELGNGSFADPMTGPVGSAVPVAVAGMTTAVAISTGAFHTCAVLADGSVQCWGQNGNAQLGNGTVDNAATPVTVPGVTNAIAVAGGGAHTCALRGDGTVLCWGDNDFGQLGDGTVVRATTPVQVAGITNAVAVAAGWRHTCAILAGGTVACWGQNEFGQLGDGTTTNRTTPVPVVGLAAVTGLTAGWWHHSCALTAGGTVRCWGTNEWGQHGDGTTTSTTAPTLMLNTTVTWSSSHPSVATVDQTGRALAVDSGATTISATDMTGAVASTWLTVRTRAALSTLLSGAGSGSVTSNPTGISCAADCSELYDVGTTVVLTATPDAQSTFHSWSGCDAVSGQTCTVTVNAATTVTATFDPKTFPLTVLKTGAGGGGVASDPAGISCGADCSESYDVGTTVVLTATPDAQSTFHGWSGCDAVSGQTCTVTVNASTTVTATFDLKTFPLTVLKNGGGGVTAAGIQCAPDCSESYAAGTTVVLTATPDARSTFHGWTGCDTVSGPTCTVTVNAATTVTATFNLKTFPLTVTKAGVGASLGTVTANPEGTGCGSGCSTYTIDTVVMLTASPSVLLTGWTGCDLVSGNVCVVTMGNARSVTATFVGLP
jgi:alpha-tubulin suppressor-like RCC1 family protein